MGFSSYNDYLNKVSNGNQIGTASWQKTLGATGAFTAGRWYNMAYLSGNPMLSRPGERLSNGQLMGSSVGWTLTSNWAYANNTLICTAGALTTASTTPATLTTSVKYGVEYTIAGVTTPGLTPSIGGTALTAQTTNGTYFTVVTSTNNSNGLIFTPASAAAAGTLSNISVVQIGSGFPLFGSDMGGLYVGTNVSTATKHLVFAGLMSAAANFVPGTWKLVDMLMAYPVDMNATGNALTTIGGNYGVAFQNGDGAWTYGAGWAYSSGTAVTYATTPSTLTLPLANFSTASGAAAQNAPVVNYAYVFSFTIASASGSSTLTCGIGGTTSSALTVANGTYSIFVTAVNATGPINLTTTGTGSFTLSNLTVTVALPRYSSGAGVQAILCWHSGSWALAGNVTTANAHNIQITYTNSAGTANRYTPVPVTGVATGPVMGHLDNSGAGGAVQGNFAPFIPLQSGDFGIQSVQTLTLSAAVATGAYAELILCKELFTLPNVTANIATERDLMNQLHSIPQIQDGANLQWLFFPGAATAVSTSVYGWLDYAWG